MAHRLTSMGKPFLAQGCKFLWGVDVPVHSLVIPLYDGLW